ncbi:hypothetical protein, partial [Mesorhizobium sp.]|uniref:hypothetical protein n=1 Tax=Mesorhizobium sp. TaxID=1871066 RepID=UPI0025C5FC6C
HKDQVLSRSRNSAKKAGHRPAFFYWAFNGLGWLADPVLQISCTAGASDDCDVSATVYEQPRS